MAHHTEQMCRPMRSQHPNSDPTLQNSYYASNNINRTNLETKNISDLNKFQINIIRSIFRHVLKNSEGCTFLVQPYGCTVDPLVNGHPWEANKLCQFLSVNSPLHNEISWELYNRASPMCSCGLFEENAYHFFLSCSLHDICRPIGCKILTFRDRRLHFLQHFHSKNQKTATNHKGFGC